MKEKEYRLFKFIIGELLTCNVKNNNLYTTIIANEDQIRLFCLTQERGYVGFSKKRIYYVVFNKTVWSHKNFVHISNGEKSDEIKHIFFYNVEKSVIFKIKESIKKRNLVNKK